MLYTLYLNQGQVSVSFYDVHILKWIQKIINNPSIFYIIILHVFKYIKNNIVLRFITNLFFISVWFMRICRLSIMFHMFLVAIYKREFRVYRKVHVIWIREIKVKVYYNSMM